MDMTGGSKKRRETEVYENYWKFTAAYTNLLGTKFHNCLSVTVMFIDSHKKEIQESAGKKDGKTEELYRRLQERIVKMCDFKGKDGSLSARKAINQFVKIGFINPYMDGYHPLVKEFLRTEDKERKRVLFSKIFYEASSLASDVTVDKRELKHMAFLLKTLDLSGPLDKEDIKGLMVTDIRNFAKGYLTRSELNSQIRYADSCGFPDRKYNQISHLISHLKLFVDLSYDRENETFRFVDDPGIADGRERENKKRDGVRHRIFKEELKQESERIYGKPVCYLEKIQYKTLIASHIKPLQTCLDEGREDEAYDVDNGILINQIADSYFDKQEISFTDDGEILFGDRVEEAVRERLGRYRLDSAVMNDKRKQYMRYHRALFCKKQGIDPVSSECKEEKPLKCPTYVDLFCGAGGLSCGFDKAGFENLLAVEMHPKYARTYRENFPEHPLIVDDIKNIPNEKLSAVIKEREVDVVIGGPPCQGFSKAGNIGRTFLEDERNYLFLEFVRVVKHLKPKMFVMENVAAMEVHRKGKTMEDILEAFRDAGYIVPWHEVLNSACYGVPQVRRRMVMVGYRKDLVVNFSYPEKDSRIRTIKEAIGDLPPLKSGEKSTIPNHEAMNHSVQMLEKMSYVKDGGDRTDIPEQLRPKSGDIRKYIRYDSQKPSVCVTGDMRKIFHYCQNRALTPRELARIQTFPDDFIFYGTSIQIQQQIGNAVPPELAYRIAVQIREALRNV